MPKKYSAGISIAGRSLQVVIAEIREGGMELCHIEEVEDAGAGDHWIAEAIRILREGGSGKVTSASVALDHDLLFLHTFPMDASLHQADQNEHVQWELSNYIADFKPQEYLNDTHVLRSRAREQTADVLMVSVRRDLLFRIQRFLGEHKIELTIVDTNYFSAQHGLMANYPEARMKLLGLAGISPHRIELGVVANGRTLEYHTFRPGTAADTVDHILNTLGPLHIDMLFLYGTGITTALYEPLGESRKPSVTLFNPFRRLFIPSSLKTFERYAGLEHRFAAAVGCALRKQ